TTWKVSPNADYGHPGELAYKIDTHIINRILDELHPDIPEFFKIADSLNDLGKQLQREGTRNTQAIKNALYQNAGALITARLEYTGRDKKTRTLELANTRYGIIFVGEELPSGETAEAIFIVLHPTYRNALKNLQRRPLDYEYLKSLKPTSQRWYEL